MNQIQKIEPGTPSEIISQAIASGADLEKLEKLLELQERWEAGEARKYYASSMVQAQEEIISVAKTKTNPQTRSKYADLESIITSAKPSYTKHGFSVMFHEGVCPIPGSIRILADVIHQAGHKEQYFYDVPLDGVGLKGNANMTAIHAKASSVSYGRRYLLCMIFNIPTGDNDAVTTDPGVTEDQLKTVRAGLAEIKASDKKILEYLNIEKLEDMTKQGFLKAMALIDARKRAIAGQKASDQ